MAPGGRRWRLTVILKIISEKGIRDFVGDYVANKYGAARQRRPTGNWYKKVAERQHPYEPTLRMYAQSPGRPRKGLNSNQR